MDPRRLLFTLLLACSTASPAIARQNDDLDRNVRAALQASCRPLVIEDRQIRGAGSDWLLSLAGEARFTLIGESHLTAETPVFTQALLHELRPDGYGAYITESGPESTRLLAEMIEHAGLAAAEAHCRKFPFSIAFLDHKEEMHAVEEALDLGYEVWGIDQEFVGSPRHLLARLREIAPDQRTREHADAALKKAMTGFRKFMSDGDQAGGYIFSATDADYDQLAEVFADVPEAQDIIGQLRASSGVYRAYAEGRYYSNNSTRIDLMKQNLLRHVARAGANPLTMPKAVFKAGTYHMGRGWTPMNVLDVGNFASELAIAAGSESLHIFVTAMGMKDGETFTSWASQSPHLDPIYAQGSKDGPVVMDLRPLRAMLTQTGKKSAQQEELQRLVLAFDVVVLYPHFTPAEALYPMPRR